MLLSLFHVASVRRSPLRFWAIAAVLTASLVVSPGAIAQTGPAEGREGLVELGARDPRLKGHYAPKGFKVEIVAAEPAIVDPTAMAFDDRGNLYVAEWKTADYMFDTLDTVKLPEGGTTKVMRRRKATNDVVKRLRDTNGDGIYDASDVVVIGAEMPSSIFPWKNSLYLTCVGRLERWSDDDGDGRFETRTIIADGFCGFYHHWLSGMTLSADGWFYLTAGDNDNHVIGSDGSRVEVSRCGGIFRGKVDGSRMNLFAMGFRNPYRDVAFNSRFDAFHLDNDNEDGSKFQGVRLIEAVEGGDYGWRLLPGAPCCQPDFDRGAVDGELPGKLPILAKTGRGAPAGLVVYDGIALPDRYRDLCVYPDVFRKLVRGYRVAPQGGTYKLVETITLMTADDDLFRPCQAVVGPDGALYVLDWRSNSGGAGRLWGDAKYGRLYKLSWEGDGSTPALPLKKNDWTRVLHANDAELLAMIRGRDYREAARALRELVSRGSKELDPLLSLMNDCNAPEHARLLGLQGARQFWGETVERAMIAALHDPSADIRRLAAQAISWEPVERRPLLIPALVARLEEPDGRALRDVALAIGRHGWAVPGDAAPPLLAWLLKHPQADVVVRDAFIRGLERIGEPGIAEVANLIRSSDDPPRRAAAVAIFVAFRTADAAAKLPELAVLPNLDAAERLALVKQFKDIPLNIPVPTAGLAAWVGEHPEVDSATKIATLDVCRLAGDPAAALVVKLLDDPSATVRVAATRLAARTRPPGAVEKLSNRLADPKISTDERIAIAAAIAGSGSKFFDAILSAYKQFEGDSAVARTLLRSLADSDRVRAEPIAERALESSQSELKRTAIQILGETPQAALKLGNAFLAGKLGRGDLPAVLAAVRRYDSAEHKKILAAIDETLAKSVAAIDVADLKASVANGSDSWRGLGIFLRESGARCYTCHKIENFGGAVGPALTGVYQALSIDKLIESLLQPSKEIKEGYESYKVALKDGRVLAGIQVSRDAKTLVLRDANGGETRVAVDQIDEQAKDPVSLMPAGLTGDLAPDELRDLLAFLLDKKAQETLRLSTKVDHVLAIGPFSPTREGIAIPLDRVDAGKTYQGFEGRTATWTRLDSNSAGMINLRGQLGLSESSAYLAFYVRSETEQDATLRLGIEGYSKIYLNGEKRGEASPSAVAITGNPVRLPLKKGWNVIVIAVDRASQGEGRGMLAIGSANPVEIRAEPVQ